MSLQNCDPLCVPDCDSPFDRVVVSYLLAGGSRVMWQLRDDFEDAGPLTFQLQVGETANNTAHDWTDVGAPVVDAYYAVDAEQRTFTAGRYPTYRVRLTTTAGVYYSTPIGINGTLDPSDWRMARAVVREYTNRLKRTHLGQEGILLKRRVTGSPCPVCVDKQSGECMNPACNTCWGTGKLCGYFYPVDCVWVSFSPRTHAIKITEPRGFANTSIAVKGLVVNPWMLDVGDVWVNRKTDDRYYAHTVQYVDKIRSVPLTADVEWRPAPLTDPVYLITIPNQIAEVT